MEANGASLQASGTVDLPQGLAVGIEADGPALVEATIVNAGRLLHLDGTIALRLRAQCVRCLEQYSVELRIPFNHDYRRGAPPASDFDQPEEDLTSLEGAVIQLDPVVCEEIILALPMKPLCREDCPGLCPVCGKNLEDENCQCAQAAGHPGLAGLVRLLPINSPGRPTGSTRKKDRAGTVEKP